MFVMQMAWLDCTVPHQGPAILWMHWWMDQSERSSPLYQRTSFGEVSEWNSYSQIIRSCFLPLSSLEVTNCVTDYCDIFVFTWHCSPRQPPWSCVEVELHWIYYHSKARLVREQQRNRSPGFCWTWSCTKTCRTCHHLCHHCYVRRLPQEAAIYTGASCYIRYVHFGKCVLTCVSW
jgi:hypothetical protein